MLLGYKFDSTGFKELIFSIKIRITNELIMVTMYIKKLAKNGEGRSVE
jgi:hypothetical protein